MTAPEHDDISVVALWPFLLIAFGLAWGILALFILLPGPTTALVGEISASHPLFILAVYAPAIAAIGLVLLHGGPSALGGFLSRLALWRCSTGWYGFLIVGIPLLFFAGAALKGNLFQEPLPFETVGQALGAIGFMLMLGPVEEFGWRGLALPLLQRRMAPVWAGLLLGLVWGVWHLPAFFLSGTPQGGWGFTPFLIASVSVSVILTPLFNAARGSILLAALFHFQLNNPLWPDAQPYDTLFFAAAAIAVVWFNRATMFSRAGSATVVIARSRGGRE